MEKIKLNYSHNDTVANIVLDDGKGNVLDNVMMLDILSCFKQFKSQPNVKLITFQGRRQTFLFWRKCRRAYAGISGNYASNLS
ncbi:MAG: hypothetical protein IPG08_10405 [Sphingobacteriaceae bacterium]|nr:hypothetical protein [Sphingobacteriaceae bacterium]